MTRATSAPPWPLGEHPMVEKAMTAAFGHWYPSGIAIREWSDGGSTGRVGHGLDTPAVQPIPGRGV